MEKQPQPHSPNLNTPIVLSDRPIVIVTIDRLMYQRCRFRTQATLKALEDEQPEGVVVTVNVKTTTKKNRKRPILEAVENHSFEKCPCDLWMYDKCVLSNVRRP